MPESFRTRLERATFDWFPACRGTGGRITAIVAAREAADAAPSVDRVYTVELRDRTGVLCAEVEKTLYVARKR